MKKGDYIRTENGIRIIEKYSRNKHFYNGHCIYFKDTPYCGVLYTDEEIKKMKSSTNIIDLIEVGDYVNGYYVEDVRDVFDGEDTYTRICLASGCNYFQPDITEKEDIKTIVTKERFESVKYEIGD